jgi:hypothetical protein
MSLSLGLLDFFFRILLRTMSRDFSYLCLAVLRISISLSCYSHFVPNYHYIFPVIHPGSVYSLILAKWKSSCRTRNNFPLGSKDAQGAQGGRKDRSSGKGQELKTRTGLPKREISGLDVIGESERSGPSEGQTPGKARDQSEW